MERAQKELLTERIRLINNDLKKLENQKDIIKEELFNCHPKEAAENINTLGVKSGEHEFTKTKKRHQEKLQNFWTKEKKAMKQTWVDHN